MSGLELIICVILGALLLWVFAASIFAMIILLLEIRGWIAITKLRGDGE